MLISGIVVMMIGLVILLSGVFSISPSTDDYSLSGLLLPLGIGFIVMIVGVVIAAWTLVLTANISKTMTKVCDSFSKKLPSVTFHFREKKGYIYSGYFSGGNGQMNTTIDYSHWIEVQYNNDFLLNDDAEQGVANSTNPSSNVAANKQPDISSRLENLDSISHLLSKEEIERKRKEILDSL